MASIKEQLARIALKKVKLSNRETLEETMARLVRSLYSHIQYYIDKWYNTYDPIVYERTYRYQGALYAEDIADIRVVDNTIRIGVRFNDELSWHTSLSKWTFTNDLGETTSYTPWATHESYVPVLMEYGWTARRLEARFHKRIENFTHFDGIHAIQRGIWDFYREHPNMYGKIKISDRLILHNYWKD